MRRLCLVLLVFCLAFSWLPAQSLPMDQGSSSTMQADPQALVSRLNLRLRTIGNGDIAIPATDLDLVFAELELVSNESFKNYEMARKLRLENQKMQEKARNAEKFKRTVPWICLATFGLGIVTGCVGGYLVQK